MDVRLQRRVQRYGWERAADGDDACAAAFAGGPVALAWSRFDQAVRARVQAKYLEAIEPSRVGWGYRVEAEYLMLVAHRPSS